MSEEEAKQSSESGEQRGDAGEEKKKPARKRTAKKVVSRVRDAKSDSADRKPKEAPVDEVHPEATSGKRKESRPKEIKTVVEEPPGDGEKPARGAKGGKGGRTAKEDRGKSGRGNRRASKSPSGNRNAEPVDSKELGKRAWKIFQADVAEEGIHLIDNATGRQLALRSFELARIFLEEKARQIRLNNPGPEKKAEPATKEANSEAAEPESEAPTAEDSAED